ncbi:hypothetical protein GCM10022288_02650 [Gryllotalpicola kribbensis]|jgi:nucleoid-associated protein YgaU|uniref:LysM domain-containing protein n=1 Tax=Gryllotalpicola kribbensis TaxID=993084 RepID=A0ABP8AGH4_9MICO
MSTITVQMSGAAGRRPAPSAGVARSHLRLTRRGRALLVAVVAAPVLAVTVWFGLNGGGAAADGHSAARPAAVEQVTVAQGQSLWQIAVEVAPHDDPRDVVAAIVDMNGLQSSVLTPGQTLAIPSQYSK